MLLTYETSQRSQEINFSSKIVQNENVLNIFLKIHCIEKISYLESQRELKRMSAKYRHNVSLTNKALNFIQLSFH